MKINEYFCLTNCSFERDRTLLTFGGFDKFYNESFPTKYSNYGSDYMEKEYNHINENCGSIHVSVLGSMKEIFKQFENQNKNTEWKSFKDFVMDWKEFYLKEHSSNLEQSIKILFEAKVDDILQDDDALHAYWDHELVRELDPNWQDNPDTYFDYVQEEARAYLSHLVFAQTPKGFIFENLLLHNLADILGETFTEASKEDERAGVDGYIGDIPICLKPVSFNPEKYNSPVSENMVYYSRHGSDVKFEFNFEIPQEWKEIIVTQSPDLIFADLSLTA